MLYSIGYQKLRSPDDLVACLQARRVQVLVDVRSRPYGRRYDWNKSRLAALLPQAGVDYLWRGDVLGGFAPIADPALAELVDWQADKVACLMCMEADPDQCHRKTEIARRLLPLGVTVEHILTGQPAAPKAASEPAMF